MRSRDVRINSDVGRLEMSARSWRELGKYGGAPGEGIAFGSAWAAFFIGLRRKIGGSIEEVSPRTGADQKRKAPGREDRGLEAVGI
jgi:hypothetical protein